MRSTSDATRPSDRRGADEGADTQECHRAGVKHSQFSKQSADQNVSVDARAPCEAQTVSMPYGVAIWLQKVCSSSRIAKISHRELRCHPTTNESCYDDEHSSEWPSDADGRWKLDLGRYLARIASEHEECSFPPELYSGLDSLLSYYILVDAL